MLFSDTDKCMHTLAGLYGTFVIEERHGFNKQTLGLWGTDLLKQASTLLCSSLLCVHTYLQQLGVQEILLCSS